MKQQVPCPHCLEPIEMDFHGECPHCGKSLDTKTRRARCLWHPAGGQIHHWQIPERRRRRAELRGVNNEEKRFVRIKEYFPVTLCNGRSADGALMPKADARCCSRPAGWTLRICTTICTG